jgi:antitoxin (DNA-binding transcriptional repressor) of toxin-antitoxin stability system
MAAIHISESAAAADFAQLLARVGDGVEIVIERDDLPVAVIHAPAPLRRSVHECIALLPQDSQATMDDDFAADVQGFVDSHRDSIQAPAWD